jgi:uncharacterized protein with gpF-like domain
MIESKNLVAPEAIGIVYSRDFRNLIKQMIKDYKSVIGIYRSKKDQVAIDADEKNSAYGQVWLTTEIQERLHKLGKKWEERFAVWAEKQSPAMVKKVLKATDTQIKRALLHFYSGERLELIGQVIPTPLKQSMKMHIMENVSLIKSVQSQYHERIVGAVSRSITNAGSIKTLTQEIYKYGDMSLRRANLISLDQTRKMYSNLTIRRFEQVGITKVKWMHTHAGKTDRPYHVRKWDGDYSNYPNVNGLNGLIFDISNPPVIQQATKTQPEIRGFPAQLPFCHCIMRAIIEE